jgi:DNA repair photolyase
MCNEKEKEDLKEMKGENHSYPTSVQDGKSRAVFGTQEWASHNENCLLGCSHDCKYCYAKSIAIRHKRKTPVSWKNELIRAQQLTRIFHKMSGRIMFPSTHDIIPAHLNECLLFLEHMLIPGNEVLIVSKPHLECIKAICKDLAKFKENILFRFTIGSKYSSILKFWEPNAPEFSERLSSLEFAFKEGFQTSISCEPMLDDNAGELIQSLSPFVTDSIWLGKVNLLEARLKRNGETDPETLARAQILEKMQEDINIWRLYFQYKDNPLIKWKGSIKKVVGIEIPSESGLDI